MPYPPLINNPLIYWTFPWADKYQPKCKPDHEMQPHWETLMSWLWVRVRGGRLLLGTAPSIFNYPPLSLPRPGFPRRSCISIQDHYIMLC